MKYSQARKQMVLTRLAPSRKRMAEEVAVETGIAEATLYGWRQQARLIWRPVPRRRR